MDGKRHTIQKQLILDAVQELNMHASAEQVFEYVAQKHPTVSKATVYRNLNQMTEHGELINIGNIDGSSRYDHNCHRHYHFICDNCKQVFDVNDYFPDLCSKVTNTGGFEISHHAITFGGLCQNCRT
jgi:Fe2+ or Zn2+ uptake regulation protein